MPLSSAQKVATMTVSLGHAQPLLPSVSQRRYSSCQNSQQAARQRSARRLSVTSMLDQRNCARANEQVLQGSSSSSSPVSASSFSSASSASSSPVSASLSVVLTALTALTAPLTATATVTFTAAAEPFNTQQIPDSFLEASLADIRRIHIDPALVSASLESPPVISGGYLPGSIATALIREEQQQQQHSMAAPSYPLSVQQRGKEVLQLAAVPVDPADVDLLLPDIQTGEDSAATVASSAPPAPPVLDAAHVLSSGRLQAVQQQVEQLEKETGWRVKVLTRDGKLPASFREAAATWETDERTVLVVEDLTSPNVLRFRYGDEVKRKVGNGFFAELQSRYGNRFFVAEEGEPEALQQSVDAIVFCLDQPEGCIRVPGLPDELYFLTLGASIAGGAVFGFSCRLEPTGRISETWQWVAVFSPLWVLLFGSFGVLPVIERTGELAPLLKNGLGFLMSGASMYLTPIFGPPPSLPWSRDAGTKKGDESED